MMRRPRPSIFHLYPAAWQGHCRAMKKHLLVVASLVLCGVLLAGTAVAPAPETSSKPSKQSGTSTPGVEAAQALSTITGVAISPLLGVSMVGAWKYFKTAQNRRAQLPWFAQPYFWIPALLIVLAVFVKDALGTAVPAALKKPFDLLEVFENKLSALIVAGAFVPLAASIFRSVGGEDSSMLSGLGLAMIEPSQWLNVLAVPFGLAVFLIVWLVAHGINILILISPFGIVDAALKSARLFLLAILTFTSLASPWLGAVLSLVIIVVCYFLAGWSFRMMIFGTFFACDLLTARQRRFKPQADSNWMFTARPMEEAPVRTYGRLHRDTQGRLVLQYRPWLILPTRELILPPGNYAIGRGLVYPELMQVEGQSTRTILDLSPRYRTHEAELAKIYGLGEVRETGVIKGFKAVWKWFRGLLGVGDRPALEQPV
jgi:hypothetical protein